MLRIADRELDAQSVKVLDTLQNGIDAIGDYPGRVAAAKRAWDGKTGSQAKAAAFASVRKTLGLMCIGSIRCAYCEDSLADEVEHIQPKNLFPQFSFRWSNYLFACGPCNGPKSNRYGTLDGNQVTEFIRHKNGPVVPPPTGQSGFINPRIEDPYEFLEMDLGGVAPDGMVIEGTFTLLPRENLEDSDKARAEFTITVLDLNREPIRKARENAFSGFTSRMFKYVTRKEAGAPEEELQEMRRGLLEAPHLSVFEDMRRQRGHLPEIADLIARAPEMLDWDIIPTSN